MGKNSISVLERVIKGKTCVLYENDEADTYLIQPIDENDLEVLYNEIEWIKRFAPQRSFTFIAFPINSWNEELSPWEALAVFGNQSFGSGANQTLAFITDALLPMLRGSVKHNRSTAYYMGGYSLAGLFSLWAAYQTDSFSGIAAVSPSVWFPGWDNYMQSHAIQTSNVYMSLGDREERTRNKTMAIVGDRIRCQYELLQKAGRVKNCTLEWNPGNHFADPHIRMAKGFAWLLNNRR